MWVLLHFPFAVEGNWEYVIIDRLYIVPHVAWLLLNGSFSDKSRPVSPKSLFQ